jgi:hypothetical protein
VGINTVRLGKSIARLFEPLGHPAKCSFNNNKNYGKAGVGWEDGILLKS